MPIVVLSARTMEAQKIAALDAGADDFVTKPFSAPEMLARVRAGLRRSARGADALPELRLGQARVDLARRAASGPDGAIHLTPLEYRVLDCLARQSGMIVTSRQLLREAWGPDRVGDSGALRVCIKGLRDKLEPDPRRPRFLVTEVGVGYRLRNKANLTKAQPRLPAATCRGLAGEKIVAVTPATCGATIRTRVAGCRPK